jgi:hypothetical protein
VHVGYFGGVSDVRSWSSTARRIAIVSAAALFRVVLADLAAEQPAQPDTSTPEPPLVRQMAGTWDVEQRMWPGAGADAITLAAAVARRRAVRGGFLEEVMEGIPGSAQEPFTRIAYFHFNAVTRRYEYVSLDSRAPQMMTEKSEAESVTSKMREDAEISLDGDLFVAPRWGNSTNVTFRYRLVIGGIVKDRQVVRLFLTPQSKGASKEFLAFEYVYTRSRLTR